MDDLEKSLYLLSGSILVCGFLCYHIWKDLTTQYQKKTSQQTIEYKANLDQKPSFIDLSPDSLYNPADATYTLKI